VYSGVAELLKCAKEPISIALHTLFAKVWITGKVPADWKDMPLSFLCTRVKGPYQTVPVTDLHLCCLYQAKCSLMLSSGDFNHCNIDNTVHSSLDLQLVAWLLNGKCYSCSAASVRAAQRILKASACGLCGY